MGAFKRYLVTCKKCGYEWLAHSENPKRCALCNNENPNEPKKRLSLRDKEAINYARTNC